MIDFDKPISDQLLKEDYERNYLIIKKYQDRLVIHILEMVNDSLKEDEKLKFKIPFTEK